MVFHSILIPFYSIKPTVIKYYNLETHSVATFLGSLTDIVAERGYIAW